jgi:hypothetical protein
MMRKEEALIFHPSYFLQGLYFGGNVDIILILVLHIATHRQIFTQLQCIMFQKNILPPSSALKIYITIQIFKALLFPAFKFTQLPCQYWWLQTVKVLGRGGLQWHTHTKYMEISHLNQCVYIDVCNWIRGQLYGHIHSLLTMFQKRNPFLQNNNKLGKY